MRCGKPTSPGPTCPECKAETPANERPYDAADWRRRSRAFLRKFPWCVLCERNGRRQRAEVADHYPFTRKELMARNVADPDAEEHLRAICRRCHARHGRSSRMRFNNDPA